LLDRYESPTGGTFRATLELGSLMFAAVAAESANQISLMAQHDANEKLVKQAERHREIMEKEFTENLARIKVENQRTIDETIRIKDELVQIRKPKISVEDDYVRRIDENQSPELVRLQLDLMRKKAGRCANELREIEERHEQELAQEKALNSIKDQDLLRERKKVKELQATIRDYEENLPGLQPTAKKIKVEDQGLIKAVAVKDQDLPAQEKVTASAPKVKTRVIKDLSGDNVLTSAYTQSSHHQRNLDIVLKKDTSVMDPNHRKLAESAKSVQGIEGTKNNHRPATREEIVRALDLRKNYLIKSEEYIPHQQRSEDRHLERIRVLKGAMSDYTRFNPAGPQSVPFQHPRFEPLQREYNIPMHYKSPAFFFKEVESNLGALFKYRLCSVWEFYDLLCKDTPGYRFKPNYGDQRLGASSAGGVPKVATISKPVQNSQPMASAAAEISEPVVKTIIRAPSGPISPSSANPSKLTLLQREGADKAARDTMRKPRNAPVPEDGDTSDSTEDDQLYDDKMLPEDKITLKKLQTSIKRIKQQNYSSHYLKTKDKAIREAEKDRLRGQAGPAYLEGVTFPWNSGCGQAPMQYENHQIDRLERKINKLRTINTAHVQLEYIANTPRGKGGPGGQGSF
jgi:hypothetical protein